MRINLFTFYIILFVITLLAPNIYPLHAVGTKVWTDLDKSGFAKGKLENVSSLSNGKLLLSPQIQKLKEVPAAYVWCLATNGTDLILAGTGDPGSIFKITEDGNIIELFKTSELHVYTIAIDNNGNIYAGTLPHGRIYKITSDGEGEIFCELPAPYIWDLIIDGSGNLYAATGNNGIIYKISDDGASSVFFDSPYSNILDLVIDKENNLYAACEPEGLIYKITPDGQASVLYDAEEDEVHCLAIDNQSGVIYAGTSSGTLSMLPATTTPVTPEAQLTPPIVGFPHETSRTYFNDNGPDSNYIKPPLAKERYNKNGIMPPPARAKNNFVFSIDKNGRVKEVLSAKKAFVLCLKIGFNNNVFVGTGNKANIFSINIKNGEESLLYNDFFESQILDILPYKDGRKYISTGNNAGIYQLSNGYSRKGSYTSVVHDAGYISSWGCISWKGKTPPLTEIKLSTRSGNSKKPDTTWSNWSREYVSSGEKIKGPPARFIQYRAILTTGGPEVTPILDNVSIAYLPQNQSPIIKDIEIITTKNSLNKKTDTNNTKTSENNKDNTSEANGDENVFDIVIQKPKKLISWSSSDPNDDSLQFDLEYKSEVEEKWKMLEGNIKDKKEYKWDTSGIPEGYYQVKITASDNIDNPADLALREEKVSNTFLIDNTSPSILEFRKIVENNVLAISGSARDEMCNISKIQYAVNSGDWNTVFPVDNIFDSKEEYFTITIPDLSPEKLTIEIKAEDAEGNVGNKKIVFFP